MFLPYAVEDNIERGKTNPGHLGTDLDISVLGPGHFGTDLDISVLDSSGLGWDNIPYWPQLFGTY